MALLDEQSRLVTSGLVYLKFTVVDAALGTLTFYLGDQSFSADNTFTGPPVSKVVTSWGSLRKFMASDGRPRSADASFEMDVNATCVPSNGTTQYKVYELLRLFQLRDVGVQVDQWNAGSSAQQTIWKGFWSGVSEYRVDERGVATVTVSLKERNRASRAPMSDIVERVAFPRSPDESIGSMVPRAYGKFEQTMYYSGEAAGVASDPLMLGLGQPMAPGVTVDEAITSQPLWVETRYSKHDGTSVADSVALPPGGSNVPGGDIWAWLSDVDAFAAVEYDSLGIVNDTASLRTNIYRSPQCYAVLRPSEKGPNSSAAYDTLIYKIIDDDPDNHADFTAGSVYMAFNCPSITPPNGGRILDLRVCVVASRPGGFGASFKFGLLNPQESGGSNWWGLAHKVTSVAILTAANVPGFYITSAANAYKTVDAQHSVGKATDTEFMFGRFVGRDANNNEVPIQVLIEDTLDTARPQIHAIALLAKIQYPVKQRKITTSLPILDNNSYIFVPNEGVFPKDFYAKYGTGRTAQDKLDGATFIARGRMLKDDGSGTYTGTANAVISQANAIGHHLLNKIGGYACNTTAGTLGNFVDARAEDVNGEKDIAISFGPEVVSVADAIDAIQRRTGARFQSENGVWNCVYDEMNPHSSRLYRSTSDPQPITPADILSGQFSLDETQFEQFVNVVTLKYAHAFQTNKPTGTYRYRNDLSCKWFGQREEITTDEPCVPLRYRSVADSNGLNPSPAAVYLARYRGNALARPRMRISVQLTQKFFDLLRGHVTWFEGLEGIGIQCPAFRCGLLEYHFKEQATVTDYADSLAPGFTVASGGIKKGYIGVGQQTDVLDFLVGTAAVYTGSMTWKYSSGPGAFTAFSSVTNADCFKSTGPQRLQVALPTATSWKKSYVTIGSGGSAFDAGPCYWFEYTYDVTSPGTAGVGNGRTTYPAKWARRLVEAIECTRRPSGPGNYPTMEAVFQEVM